MRRAPRPSRLSPGGSSRSETVQRARRPTWCGYPKVNILRALSVLIRAGHNRILHDVRNHLVRGYEDAGVIAVQIEDQEFPKKCGHTPFKRVVPTRDMVVKVTVFGLVQR